MEFHVSADLSTGAVDAVLLEGSLDLAVEAAEILLRLCGLFVCVVGGLHNEL